MTDHAVASVESVGLVGLLVCYVLALAVMRLRRTRPGWAIGIPLVVALVIRFLAIAGIASTGLESTLRGGDETTFLMLAHLLAKTPWGHGFWPHKEFQLQTVIFAIQLKAFNSSVGAMRITQVGLALLGIVLILASVYDLAGPRAARLAAWLFAFEPASIFFNSALHKEPIMELAGGLVVFGGTRIWQRLDIRGIFFCGLGGLIAVETRSYAGWFLVAAAVLLLLHAALRGLDRPMRAMPLIYGVVALAFIATPILLQASTKKNLQNLQNSQNANATGAGEQTRGANGDNLKLEQVNYSTRGAIVQNLPQRMADVAFRPYPWQLGDTSQRFGAVGTLFAYAIIILLIRYCWQARGSIFGRAGPFLYPLFFLWIAYSLSAGNAGTGFRYRTHLITLAVAAMVSVRAQAQEVRAGQHRIAANAGEIAAAERGPVPVPV